MQIKWQSQVITLSSRFNEIYHVFGVHQQASQFEGSAQGWKNSSALAMESLQSCAKTSIYAFADTLGVS